LYQEAKRLKFDHPFLAEVEGIMKLSPEALLKRQYAKATASGLSDRAIEKEIALKELFLDKMGSMFSWNACAALRPSEEYASVLWFGKAEAAASMRVWQNQPIPQSLTQISDAATNKKAQQVYVRAS
jgi:hypothetical protein